MTDLQRGATLPQMTTNGTHQPSGGDHDKASEKLAFYLKVRVGQELKDSLRRLANAEGRSVGNLVRRVLQEVVENEEESQKETGR